jgi:hypothetical protein
MTCEPEDDLNRSKHVFLCNKWNVVVFGQILFDFYYKQHNEMTAF